jgi:hypothetical protein
MTLDERIQEIALHLIRKASMKPESWRVTAIGAVRPGLPELKDGELPLVSASFPEGDWYLWSSRRMISVCDGVSQEMSSEEVAKAEFGNFKGSLSCLSDLNAPMETAIATIHGRSEGCLKFRYELGYASMGPIQCHKFWKLKYPIIDRLMTPSERAAYRTR